MSVSLPTVISVASVLLVSIRTSRSAVITRYQDNAGSKLEDLQDGNSMSRNYFPLFLTPLIEEGRLLEARLLAMVPSLVGQVPDHAPVVSYSGYLTSRAKDNANLFFWFFAAELQPTEAPLVLWLNGGPGRASMSGLFGENGPYYVDANLTILRRPQHWATEFNMLYIDSPVGAGFSFVDPEKSLRTNTTEVALDLHIILKQFFALFPEFKSNKFFLAGESYGGNYVLSLADQLAKEPLLGINISGIIVISGFIDLSCISHRANFLFELGLVGRKQRDELLGIERNLRIAVKSRNITKMAAIMDELFFGFSSTSRIEAMAGNLNGESVFNDVTADSLRHYSKMLEQRPDVLDAIHVGAGTVPYRDYYAPVYYAMLSDLASSQLPMLEGVLERGTRVLLMSGNADSFTTPAAHACVLDKLRWAHADSFVETDRVPWRVNAADLSVAGYAQCHRNLCSVLVRNAGHRLPADQMLVAKAAIYRFVHQLSFQN